MPDGTYDAFVINATDLPSGADRTTALELTIVSGAQRGGTLALTAPHWLGEPVDLIGMPATLTVAHRVPSVRIDT
ncbi:MAG: hypothetical protein M9942_12475 [Microthrixaceae bacterium]|nr:hypothetical protein [Microthrixaceae bacterium]MCO5319239.1 hypothetical protein [Microthrixaceae bacterium]